MRLYADAKMLVDNSTLPTAFPKDYNAFTALEADMDPYKLFSYMHTFNNNDVASRINIDQNARI